MLLALLLSRLAEMSSVYELRYVYEVVSRVKNPVREQSTGEENVQFFLHLVASQFAFIYFV